jgi:hypothetical protein
MSLPRQLNYGTKQSCVASVSSVFQCQPSNSATNYTPGSTISFDLPVGQRATYLDTSLSYLRFTITPTITGGTSPTWNALGPDFIASQAMYNNAGGTQLEQVSNYNLLHGALRAQCSTFDNVITSDTIMLGGDGKRLRCGADLASGTAFTYCVPILSLMGLATAEDFYLPTCKLGSPLRLEFTLASALSALGVIGGGTPNYVCTDPIVHMQQIVISDIADREIDNLSKGVFAFNSTIWRNYRNIYPAQQASNSIMIPARFTSLRNIIAIQREASIVESATNYSQSDFIKNQLVEYQFSVGSQMANAKPVNCRANAPEAYMELRKLFSGLTSESLPTLITRSEWIKEVSTTVAADASGGSFHLGLQCEPFANVDKLLSGLNSTGSPIYLNLTYNPSQVANIKAAVWDFFVQADCLVQVSNGEMKISY